MGFIDVQVLAMIYSSSTFTPNFVEIKYAFININILSQCSICNF